MPKRMNWKKGMRLTDEVLRTADDCTAQAVGQAVALAASGRFGLLPALRPFQLSLNVAADAVEVASLCLLAVTRAGDVIDLRMAGGLTDMPNSRVALPDDANEVFLVVNVLPQEWVETGDGLLVPRYSFSVVTPQSALSEHAMPIAHLVRENGWMEDSARFVPPCLCLSAHHGYEELRVQLVDVLKAIHEKTKPQAQSLVKTAIGIYWPIVQQALIEANTAYETMSPGELMACIQKVVGGFAMACEVDEVLHLEDAATFYNYAMTPYNYQKVYLRIRQGIGMCHAISEKIDKFALLGAAPPPPPAPQPEPKPDPRRSWLGKQI